MVRQPPRATASIAIPLALAVAACGKPPAAQQEIDRLDRELAAGNAVDPVLATALDDQIMVDPSLAQSSNVNAIRPPDRPASGAMPADDVAARALHGETATLRPAPAAGGACPACAAKRGALTLGELARRQRDPGVSGCAPRLGYSAAWATRLPAALPLYPDARVIEAAGADADGCRLRVVSFASAAPVDRLIDWYNGRATAAGYTAAHEADADGDVLGGTKDDAAYVVYVAPRRGGGSSVDLIANAGR